MGWFNQPAYTQDEMVPLVIKEAQNLSLDPRLMCAIVEQESSWNPWSMRYEPLFFTRYTAPLFAQGKISVDEAYFRATSWGLMQVMGQVAREAGFDGKFLSELCDPQTGAGVGCFVFQGKLKRANGDIPTALQYWNGGKSPTYSSEVIARMVHYK